MIISAVILRDTVKKSREYNRELDSLKILSTGDEYIKGRLTVLEKTARTGLSSYTSLNQEFVSASEKILKKALLEKQNKSTMDEVLIKLSSIVHVRKINGEEASQKREDIIARMNSAIEADKISVAIAEARNLPSSDTQILSKWLEQATDYQNATIASEEILQYVTRPNIRNS